MMLQNDFGNEFVIVQLAILNVERGFAPSAEVLLSEIAESQNGALARIFSVRYPHLDVSKLATTPELNAIREKLDELASTINNLWKNKDVRGIKNLFPKIDPLLEELRHCEIK